jgi:hypothetical protein
MQCFHTQTSIENSFWKEWNILKPYQCWVEFWEVEWERTLVTRFEHGAVLNRESNWDDNE